MRRLKGYISLLMMVCMMAGVLPETFAGMIGEAVTAHAEMRTVSADNITSASGDKTPVTDELESGGWRYRICADGYAELFGYTDASVTSLTFPSALDGVWVVRVADGGFAENIAVNSITVPAQISEIPSTAFPDNTQMTVHAYNGTAALAFASVRGFDQDNQSEYDLFDDILDLSELKPSQWSLSGNTFNIEAPYSRMISIGARIYLPPKDEYVTGLPVEITSYNSDEGSAQFSELSFEEAVESFRAENVQMVPDIDHIQILAEGVEFDESAARRSMSGTGKVPLSFNLNLKLNDAFSISGSVGYTPSLAVSVDYEAFKINELSYENKTTSSWKVKVKGKGKYIDEHPIKAPLSKSKKLARVPMVETGTPLSVWLDLSVEITVEGEVTFKGEYSTSEKVSWKEGKKLKKTNSDSEKNLIFLDQSGWLQMPSVQWAFILVLWRPGLILKLVNFLVPMDGKLKQRKV